MKKYAALFGGSGNNTQSKEYLETIEIGSFLADMGYIVKNGIRNTPIYYRRYKILHRVYRVYR